ncbi:MAG: exosortase B [Rhizobacter sp.]
MSTAVQHSAAHRLPAMQVWLPLVAGLLTLLLPTYVRLNATLWNDEAYQHGVIIVGVFWWLAWRNRQTLLALPIAGSPVSGGLALAGGLLLYFIGRSQNLPLFEVTAHLPLLTSVLLLVWGTAALRVMWFPLLFLAFMIPLPGFVMVAMTSELKQHVSVAAETLLYHAGYPIARDGVMISIGPYRMLVADACSGLNSIYSLAALGLLYMHLTYTRSWARNLMLLAVIVPIAFVANVIRVMVLILLTYHFGDEVGQGFLHNASGVLLFVVALMVLLALDWGMRRLTGRGTRKGIVQ